MPKQHTNSRTSAFLRERGFTIIPLQTWNAAKQIRQDACGLWDTLAYHPRHGIILAQNTTKTHLADHRRAIEGGDETPNEAVKWLQSTGKALLISWRKVGAKSKGARLLWKPRIEQIVLKSGKLSFARIEEIPTLGQPAPTVVMSAKEKRCRAMLQREQVPSQARVVAILAQKLADKCDREAAA